MSPMFDMLAQSVGKGMCYVSESIRWAQAAVAEGASANGLLTWSSLGNKGARMQHAERDLFNWLDSAKLMGLDPYIIWLPRLLKDKLEVVMAPTAMILPHEWLHAVYNAGEMQWHLSLLGPGSVPELRRYWELALQQEWAQQHPACRQGTEKLLPLVFHIDGTEVFTNTEANKWSMSSALASADTIESNLPLLGLMEEEMHHPTVRAAVHREVCGVIGWSMDCASRGIMPWTGYYNEEFGPTSSRFGKRGHQMAGGWRAAMVGVKADGKMRVQTHCLTRWYGCGYICDLDLATQPYKNVPHVFNYGNLGRHAPWRLTMISHQWYLKNDTRSPWSRVPGFHIKMKWRDLMHALFQGCGQDLCGSVLWDFVVELLLAHPDPDKGLKMLYLEMKAWCKLMELTCPTRVFSLALIGKGDKKKHLAYPILPDMVKAAHVKVILVFLAYKANLVCDGSWKSSTRAVCCWGLAHFLYICDQAGPILSPSDVREIERGGYAFLDAYQALAADAQSRHEPNYKIRPKLHDMCHIIDIAIETRMNPRTQSCFAQEDLMGKLGLIGKHTHGSTFPLRFLQRHLLHLSWRWQRRRQVGMMSARL